MKIRKVIVVICFISVPVIFLFLLSIFTAANKSEYFKWVPVNPEDSLIQVTTGKTVVVPFEFRVGANVTEMSFDIKDESLKKRGVSIESSVVRVRNSIASSRVIFNFRPEAGIKAGHYYLTVIARDADNGKIIREGEIPFAVDISDLTWKCSC